MSIGNEEFRVAISCFEAFAELKKTCVIRHSWIPEADLGLFAAKSIPCGTVVCRYEGKQLSTGAALRLQDKSYLMRLGPQRYVDARECLHVIARYINDCRNTLGYNVMFSKHADLGYADVVAIRDIAAGEELFCDYGKWYWLSLPSSRLSFAELQKLKTEHCVP